MIETDIDGRIGFETDGKTLRIHDALEGEELPLRLDREPDPQPALPELFPFPVDRAASFEAESISIPAYSAVTVREAGGEFVARLDDPMDLPCGSYCFDVTGVTKVLVRVADVEVSTTGMAGPDPVRLEFDRPVTVTVGARSLHTRPEATITVPDDPAALAEAVSVFGSSIKEFSPERSWPTLRGYPPRIERGDELDIPSPLVVPDTGVEIVVRPTYADVYRLSTLAYYLGARMVIGDEPAIRLDNGYVEALPTDGVALEGRAEELLRTWFFLDTLARTEGYVPSDRYEYEQVGSVLPFYPPKLAGVSMSERLMEYLEVDAETVAPYMPAWPTEAVLRPGPEAAELLPHLAHVLAPAQVRESAGPATPDAPMALATSPWLTPEDESPNPDTTPIPAGTSVLTPATYENRLQRASTPRGELRVVVMDDSPTRSATIRRAISQPAVPDGVGSWEVLDRPDAGTVREVLRDPDVDIAYCGLPVENGRVVAADETVTVGDLDDAPAMAIFEGTDDVAVGRSIVENGGVASVVVEEPFDPAQFRSLVGLLASGTAVAASLLISECGTETRTRLIGDPGVTVASNSGTAMNVNFARSLSSDEHIVEHGSVLSLSERVGHELWMLMDGFDERSKLVGGKRTDNSVLDSVQLLDVLEQDDSIVRLNGSHALRNDGLTEEDIEKSARRALAEDAGTNGYAESQHQE